MIYPRLLVLCKRIQLYVVNTLENIIFYARIFLFQFGYQRLYLTPRRKGIFVPARKILREFASASDKLQTVVFLPAQNVVF